MWSCVLVGGVRKSLKDWFSLRTTVLSEGPGQLVDQQSAKVMIERLRVQIPAVARGELLL